MLIGIGKARYAELEKWSYKWLEDQGCAGGHCMSLTNLITDLTSYSFCRLKFFLINFLSQ